MASKKCPKCGEDNPAEAVMCWACYTPLSGGPAMAGGAPIGGAAVAAPGAKTAGPVGGPIGVDEEPAKKSIDPKMIGVVAFLLVGGVVAFLVNGGMGGGGGGEGEEGGTDPNPANTNNNPAPNPGPAPAPQPIPPSGPVAPGPAPAPQPIPFTTIAPPNPQYATGTMGILVNKPGMSPTEAAGYAKFAKNQYTRNGKWKNMQICVFADQQTASNFTKYQGKRRGAPLTNADYQQLSSQGVWNGTPAYLNSVGGKELVYYPSRNPSAWWPSR